MRLPNLGHQCIKPSDHLWHADDLCLLSVSSAEMQGMLDYCDHYAFEHDVLYDGGNLPSQVISCFIARDINSLVADVYLTQSNLLLVNSHKYLGRFNFGRLKVL